LDRAAAFEEMSAQGYSPTAVEEWLEAVTEFAVERRCVRLIYFHPPGILQYHDLIDKWMEQAARFSAAERFRWYTMAQLATYLNARKLVRWSVSKQSGVVTVRASHPATLEHVAWRLPASGFAEPAVIQGSATVAQDGKDWIVTAGAGRELQFQAKVGPR
jgi:hypothetical protein